MTSPFTQELFLQLFERQIHPAMLLKPDGIVVLANEEARRLFGMMDARPPAAQSMALSASPEFQALLYDSARQGWARGTLVLRRSDGGSVDVDMSLVAMGGTEGSDWLVATCRDLTEWRLAERSRRESEARLSFALDAAEIGDWDMDLRTNVARRSLRHDRCFGYKDPVETWGYDTFLAHVDPADRHRVDACFQRAMSQDGDYDVEFRVRWPDGSVHWLWSKGRFYFDESGSPHRVAGIQVDISERRHILESLREREEQLSLVLEATGEGIWDWDIVRDAIRHNRRWCEMLGVGDTLLEHPAQAFEQHIHPEDRDRVLETVGAALKGNASYRTEYRFVRGDGRTLWVEDRGAVVQRDPQGLALRMVGSIADIHKRRQAEEALRQLNEDLERRIAERTAHLALANKELEAFAYSVSHDLRTPLRTIHGFCEVLISEQDLAQADNRRRLERVQAAAIHMGHLIEDLLELSRMSRAELRVRTVDLSALAAEITAEIDASNPKCRVDWRIEPDLAVRGDPGLLRVALTNLLDNGRKYTGKVEHPRVDLVQEGRDGACLKLLVRDNGAGFDSAHSDMLFKPFRRLHAAHEFEGTGIGLAIVERVIARHGGTIRGEGHPGAGASFHFTLAAAS